MQGKCVAVPKRKKISSGTKEWADYNVNCIKGCYNNCRYCYAKMMAKRFGRSTEKTWENMIIRKEAVTRNYGRLSGRVMFPSSHDIFDFPRIRNACFTVLNKLLESGNNVLVTTKPRFTIIQQIDELFSGYKDILQFRFTITSNSNRLLEFWEPNASPFHERLKSLKYAFNRGYRTSLSIEPFLDYDPCKLVETVAPFSTESIWIGQMNYIPRQDISKHEIPFYNEIRRNYEIEHLKEVYDDLKNLPKIRFKDSIRNRLEVSSLKNNSTCSRH